MELARHPFLLVPLLLSAASIASLLLYFYGVVDMRQGVEGVLLPAVGLFIVVLLWGRWTARKMLYNRLLAGLWAGALATLAYDLVRVPVAWSGIPVFKAISYFGMVILGEMRPTFSSEVIGWTYHLSNGIGFGVMYTVLVSTPRWWTATLWGLVLEGAMLLTPYAEVFGYRISPPFMTITIGSHVIYGMMLWAALKYWLGDKTAAWSPKRPALHLACVCMLVPFGIGAVAVDFHVRHGPTLPQAPPGYLGSHLYTTWNVLEPDRLAAMWVLQRFIDPRAQFYFVSPFSQIPYGTPFDTPEAVLRRSATQSVTEVLLARYHLENKSQFALLAQMTHLYEVTPWMRLTNLSAHQLGQDLITATSQCSAPEIARCVERAFQYLDRWYTHMERQG